MTNPSNICVIDSGKLRDSSGNDVEYEIRHGWDLVSSNKCDVEWSRWYVELFDDLSKQNLDDDKLHRILSSIQTEDSHWNWSAKSYHSRAKGYEWLYLYANGVPQGACLTFHPQDSAIEDSQIFYVKFVAVAPWNRNCLIRQRVFKGVGSLLLMSAQKMAIEQLGLTPGFCLHSLPQATEYYEKLEMVNVADKDEDALIYFELPSAAASKRMEQL